MPSAQPTIGSASEHGAKKSSLHDAPRRMNSMGDSPAALKNQKVDRFGFITNIDSNGKILPRGEQDDDKSGDGEPEDEAKRLERREKKWNSMMQTWDSTNRRRQKLVLNRLRKGLPDSIRGKMWPVLGGVNKKMKEGNATRDIYQALLQQCEEENQHALDFMPPEGPNQSKSQGLSLMVRSNSFQNIQETIERDIHRTFPRHTLFYDEENHKDDLPPPAPTPIPRPLPIKEEEEDSTHGLGGLCNEDLTALIMELDVGSSPFEDKKKSKPESKTPEIPPPAPFTRKSTCESMVRTPGGQASLRRVLCAYSYFDREVGYCQGMNFIAAMFITIMSEEEAFWMLVAVMNEDPCNMRGLFGKGMSETHKVLFVAEKLIHHFLPKLAKHLDKENVHVTMYATQWLLTQYTSSFNFDLVTRVWDCFLVEGFKTIYRVMLALLQQVQPVLLQKSFEEILGFFRDLPDQVDGNTIMETALKIPLKRKHIARYENEWLAQQKG